VRPWFERDGQCLQRELSAFATAGIVAEINEDARRAGVLELKLVVQTEAGPLELIATFPDLYPFFKPEVRTAGLKLDRHQNPMGGNLCLIGRRTSRWFAEETLADVITEQLVHLTRYAATGDVALLHAVEEPQGEPASEYYSSAAMAGSFLLVDSAWHIPTEIRRGGFTARCAPRERTAQGVWIVRGYIEKVSDERGVDLVTWTGPHLDGFDEQVPGRWIRRDGAILSDVEHFEEELGQDRDWLSNSVQRSNKASMALGAVLFPEEIRHTEYGDGWIVMQWSAAKLQRGRERMVGRSFVRVARAGSEDLAARMPATATLASKSVVLFGAGAIGAPAAIELVRAGLGRLTVVDHDVMEPATARRWPFGVTAFGRRKIDVLREWLNANYPWTDVHIDDMKVGAAEEAGPRARQGARLADLLAGADLILDATAEMGVAHLLSEWAHASRLPYVLANATPGIWGGMVARFLPDTPCWMCMREALYGSGSVQLPPADPAGDLQPPGCAEPTFNGSGFDAQEVSLEMVRTVAGILGRPGGYPEGDWNLATLELRDDAGRRIPPRWTAREIPRKVGCRCSERH
jgi:hypothetical protein